MTVELNRKPASSTRLFYR